MILPAMLRAITPQTRVIFVGQSEQSHRHNGAPRTLAQFIDQRPRNILLVLDEAYIEFLDKPLDLLPLIRAGNKAQPAVDAHFSKIYGLAGLRIGYGIAHPEVDRGDGKGAPAVQHQFDRPGRGAGGA